MVNKDTILSKTKTISTTKDNNIINTKISSSPDPTRGETSKEETIGSKNTTKKLGRADQLQETITIVLDNRAIEKETIMREDIIITIIIPKDQTFPKRSFYKMRLSNTRLISW